MTQITSGIRSILSISFVYSLYQKIVFPNKGKMIHEYVKPYAGQKLLDIGCGTGEIIKFLPDVDYLGIDPSYEYIKTANERYNKLGAFRQVDVNNFTLENPRSFDAAFSIGVLHHVSDEEGINLFKIAKNALKPGGRFIAAEPCYVDGQSFLAKWIISKDRGQNVKDKNGYIKLASEIFEKVNVTIRHDLLRIPYTLIIIECIA